jgi:hypothetical protein
MRRESLVLVVCGGPLGCGGEVTFDAAAAPDCAAMQREFEEKLRAAVECQTNATTPQCDGSVTTTDICCPVVANKDHPEAARAASVAYARGHEARCWLSCGLPCYDSITGYCQSTSGTNGVCTTGPR